MSEAWNVVYKDDRYIELENPETLGRFQIFKSDSFYRRLEKGYKLTIEKPSDPPSGQKGGIR